MQVKPATKITLLYLLLGIAWILLSDRILYSLIKETDDSTHIVLQQIKGIFYVLFTAYLLYVLIKSFYRNMEERLLKLEAREQELSALQRLSKTGNWEYDLVTEKILWSLMAEEIFEIDSQFRHTNKYLLLEHLKDTSDREKCIQAYDDARFRAMSFDFELEITTAKGVDKWIRVVGTPIIQNGLCTKIFGSYQDISSKKEGEHKALEALERYDILSRATRDTIWDWDVKSDFILYNMGIENVFGYTKGQYSNTFGWRKRNIHKSNRDDVMQIVDEIFARNETTFQCNYRFRCEDGTYKYVHERAHITYNKSGEPVRVIGAMQDITNEMEMEARIEKAVTNMQEQERQQLGMELHDNVNQILAAALLYIGLIKNGKDKGHDVNHLVVTTEQYIKEAIEDVRRLSHELAPVSFKDVTIRQVFTTLFDMIKVQKLFEVEIHIDPMIAEQLPLDLKINLYRILQEQLNNIIKHAQATEVLINLTLNENIISLQIKDNGRGFDPKAKSGGIGLENIRRRARLFQGDFHLNTAPGKGCEVLVELALAVDRA